MARKRVANADAQERDDHPERQGSTEMNSAMISGATFVNKAVVYYEVNGMAMVEGDIALGTVEQVKETTEAARGAVSADPAIAFGVGLTGSQFRWPNCQVPYEVDPTLPNQQRVADAIAHWEANTAFRFPLRTAANATQHPNFIRFTDSGGCWSFVGMQGGQQLISLGAGCTTGNAIHEIGHAVGLWHEQSREDRDLFVTINWQNIQSGMAAQFNQHITDGDDLGAYDYGSIMHYPRTAFSANGQETITPTDPNAQVGQRNGLSAGDMASVREMYPACSVKLPWVEPGGQFKKIFDDRERFKKLRDDPIGKPIRDPKPILDPKVLRDPKSQRDPKAPRDPKNVLDPGPKHLFDPGPKALLDGIGRPGVGFPIGTLQPFSMATPHHASLAPGIASGGQGVGATAYLTELHQQLLELEAAIAASQAVTAQADAESARLRQARDIVAAAYEEAARHSGA